MREALIIFVILLVLLTIISVFGGSIRYTPPAPARGGGASASFGANGVPAFGPPPLFGGSSVAPFETYANKGPHKREMYSDTAAAPSMPSMPSMPSTPPVLPPPPAPEITQPLAAAAAEAPAGYDGSEMGAPTSVEAFSNNNGLFAAF